MKVCPICREQHDPKRVLSFDGKGVNSCGMYASRLATLAKDCPPELGIVFAHAPAILALLRRVLSDDPKTVNKKEADSIILEGRRILADMEKEAELF